jgi:hypothetical protein
MDERHANPMCGTPRPLSRGCKSAANKFLFRNIDGTTTGELMADHNEGTYTAADDVDHPAHEETFIKTAK